MLGRRKWDEGLTLEEQVETLRSIIKLIFVVLVLMLVAGSGFTVKNIVDDRYRDQRTAQRDDQYREQQAEDAKQAQLAEDLICLVLPYAQPDDPRAQRQAKLHPECQSFLYAPPPMRGQTIVPGGPSAQPSAAPGATNTPAPTQTPRPGAAEAPRASSAPRSRSSSRSVSQLKPSASASTPRNTTRATPSSVPPLIRVPCINLLGLLTTCPAPS